VNANVGDRCFAYCLSVNVRKTGFSWYLKSQKYLDLRFAVGFSTKCHRGVNQVVYNLVDLLAVCCSFEKLPRVAIGEYRAKGKVTNRVPSLRVSTPLLLHRQTDFHG